MHVFDILVDAAKQIFKVDEPIYIPTSSVCDFSVALNPCQNLVFTLSPF